jgi:hypothetical protein
MSRVFPKIIYTDISSINRCFVYALSMIVPSLYLSKYLNFQKFHKISKKISKYFEILKILNSQKNSIFS